MRKQFKERKLFKGGNYMRKYGTCFQLPFRNLPFLGLDTLSQHNNTMKGLVSFLNLRSLFLLRWCYHNWWWKRYFQKTMYQFLIISHWDHGFFFDVHGPTLQQILNDFFFHFKNDANNSHVLNRCELLYIKGRVLWK